ncbi:hypothetical protein [Blastococcus sp. DSM 46786]|uniref:hypothetical protein n=1 Tax=Blastococcus sp. DSM 46786 TaxID=1798227 RepID=UPI00111347B9|nr:hypothetical protein [Blastococcus sp. DSM 46786]
MAAAPGGAVGDPTWRANAIFVDDGSVVDLTVAEAAAARATVTVGLYLDGWECTVDGQPAVADVVRLESARVVGTVGYACSEATGGGEGLMPATLEGTVALDVTWTGVGDPAAQPLFDGAVGRYVVRDAEVAATVSVTGGLSAAPEGNFGHLARESTVIPPGRLR